MVGIYSGSQPSSTSIYGLLYILIDEYNNSNIREDIYYGKKNTLDF